MLQEAVNDGPSVGASAACVGNPDGVPGFYLSLTYLWLLWSFVSLSVTLPVKYLINTS